MEPKNQPSANSENQRLSLYTSAKLLSADMRVVLSFNYTARFSSAVLRMRQPAKCLFHSIPYVLVTVKVVSCIFSSINYMYMYMYMYVHVDMLVYTYMLSRL